MSENELLKDWRFRAQDNYLKNKALLFKKYEKYSESWDHDHCEFCMKKIRVQCMGDERCTEEGYTTLDNYYWICVECYDDFKEMFQWTVEEN